MIIVLNKNNQVLRVNTLQIVINSEILVESGCRIWYDSSMYKRYAKRKGLPDYYALKTVTATPKNEPCLLDGLHPVMINTRFIEQFISSYNQ